MKTVAIIQARMGSTRLPAKVVKVIKGKTVLAHVVERVRACPLLDDVVVATTTAPSDDGIVELAEGLGVNWFRGSEDDVLERYYLAAKQYGADVVVRITSDCPVFDPSVLAGMLARFGELRVNGAAPDYMSNFVKRTYPRGLDAEVFTFKALEKAFESARLPHEREHVTAYIYQRPEEFSIHGYEGPEDLSRLRWTLDTQDDLKLIEELYAALYKEGELFTTAQAVELIRQRPELEGINAHVEQKKLGE